MLRDEIIICATSELLWAVTWSPMPWKAPLDWDRQVSSFSEWEEGLNILAVAGRFTTLWYWLCSVFRVSITQGLWTNTFTSLAEIKSLSRLFQWEQTPSHPWHTAQVIELEGGITEEKYLGVCYVVVWTWMIIVFLFDFKIYVVLRTVEFEDL